MANAVRQRDARARGAGGSSVRDRFGQRANQCAGRRWARGAKGNTKHRDGDNRSAKDRARRKPRRRKPRRQRSRRLKGLRPLLMDSRSEGSSSNREGGSSWTSSVTSMPSPPRTRSTHARSPPTGVRAATRTSMRGRRVCSSTYAVRSRAKSSRCISRPTSTAAATFFGCARRMGAAGGLLAGQTWSTFVDESNFPNTIDFESPMAFPSIRQAQLRCTGKPNENVSWSVAVEDNKSTITSPTGEPGKAEYPMPDVVGNFRFAGSRGHAFVSGFVGKGRFRPTDGNPDSVTLWGFDLSGRLKTFGRDYAYTQFTFGDGVGRYRGGVTAVPDFNGELQPVGLSAWMFGYEHYWSDRLLVERGLQRGVDGRQGLLLRRVQQGPRLRRGQSHLLVSAQPSVGRRRVSLRPSRGLRWQHRQGQSASVRDSLQPPVVFCVLVFLVRGIPWLLLVTR